MRGDKVRLGIEAPREVSVHRREVYEAIQRENQQASQIRLDDARQIGKSSHRPSSSAPWVLPCGLLPVVTPVRLAPSTGRWKSKLTA